MLAFLKEKASRFPDLPGVYIFRDADQQVIYVGKALSLRNRVRSYLVEGQSLAPRLRSLQGKLADLDYMVTDSEVEALILECNLIKEHRPRFNVNLKDDKDYPYLILTAELYPRLELLRLSQKGSRRGRYQPVPGREERRFGPYTNVRAVRETMRLLQTIFPLRRCRRPLDGNPVTERPCLNYQLKRCLAPCRGLEAVKPDEYLNITGQVILFLQGRIGEVEKRLRTEMEEAAAGQRFEEAAQLRDRLLALQRVAGQQQKMLATINRTDRDVIALARLGKRAAAHLFRIRDGKLLGQDHYPLSGAAEVDDAEVAAFFIKSYYSRAEDIPAEVILSDPPEDLELLGRWLKLEAGRKVNLRIPRRGSLKKLVELARRNCYLRLEEAEEKRLRRIEQPLAELARILGLPGPPERIEGFDISHLAGSEAVGSMVVYRHGEPDKAAYRRFHIRRAPAGDDYAALYEVLQRRSGQTEWPNPGLILIDGGKGQLATAREALRQGPLCGIPLLAMAKNPDRLFLEGSSLPLSLAADSPLLQMLQIIRDESHRFAVSGHHHRRHRSVRSRLEEIPGVGPARRAALLRHFGALSKIRQAGPDELAAVPGIGTALAEVISAKLQEN